MALPADIRQQYAKKRSDLLTPTTPMLLITGSYDQKLMEGPPFSVDETEVKKLYEARFCIKQLYEQLVMEIAVHLKERGLVQARAQVYLLEKR